MFAKELNLWLHQFFMERLNREYSDDEGQEDEYSEDDTNGDLSDYSPGEEVKGFYQASGAQNVQNQPFNYYPDTQEHPRAPSQAISSSTANFSVNQHHPHQSS